MTPVGPIGPVAPARKPTNVIERSGLTRTSPTSVPIEQNCGVGAKGAGAELGSVAIVEPGVPAPPVIPPSCTSIPAGAIRQPAAGAPLSFSHGDENVPPSVSPEMRSGGSVAGAIGVK
jgi:hypothetical protein